MRFSLGAIMVSHMAAATLAPAAAAAHVAAPFLTHLDDMTPEMAEVAVARP